MNEDFWEVACDHVSFVKPLVAAIMTLGVLTVASIALTEPDTASGVIARIDLILIVVALGIALYFRKQCEKLKEKRSEWRVGVDEEDKEDASDA